MHKHDPTEIPVVQYRDPGEYYPDAGIECEEYDPSPDRWTAMDYLCTTLAILIVAVVAYYTLALIY